MKAPRRNFSIGRDRSCDIPIADDSVSRIHAELTVLEDGTILLRDCGSSNGTRLLRHGAPRNVRQETIQISDQVQFGDATLSVSDLLAGIWKKFPAMESSISSSSIPNAASAKAAKLVRCGCGTVRPVDQPCPECGQ